MKPHDSQLEKRIVMLCSACFSTTAIYNHINKSHTISAVIMEKPLRGWALAKRRVKRLGLIKVSGQIAFSLFIVPVLNFVSKNRRHTILKNYSFELEDIPEHKIAQFLSVNDVDCIDYLKSLNPDIVIVNGTRILSSKLLNAVNAVFINMHVGITPQYRGVHGAYWALVENDFEHCGVTIHLVDKGIDTGAVLYQTKINTTSHDNFTTYPFIQFGEGMKLMLMAVDDAVNNKLTPRTENLNKGKLWYHPGFWQYLYLRIVKGKK